ncbi:MAG: FAD-binding oxidoreductase [Burkholderiaceae bacterium]
MNATLSRRKAITLIGCSAVAASSKVAAKCPADPLSICNVTQLNTVKAGSVITVQKTEEIQYALKTWQGHISIGGGRYSMGGQTGIEAGLQLDMRSMNKLLSLDPSNRTVRVQAGMRWRDLQELIDPQGLAIQTMQSYSNFTIGGSLSVNCHGRYVGHGPVSESVRSIKLVLPHGDTLEVNRQSNSELFQAAIGGYGGVGVITEIELNLDENFKIEKSIAHVSLEDYPAWFRENIISNPSILLHNADLQPSKFNKPRCVTWSRTEKPLTISDRLRPEHIKYGKEKLALWALSELPGSSLIREKIVTPIQEKPEIVWRNYEASMDAAELEPVTRNISTYVLQEYFIPERHFAKFANAMSKLMQSVPTGTINVSIRHSPADRTTLMSWAQQDVFSFVVYYKQRVSLEAVRAVGDWTRAMINLALKMEGTYYLPYQLHATQQQFLNSYPAAAKFKALRQQLGGSRLTNTMWKQYQI